LDGFKDVLVSTFVVLSRDSPQLISTLIRLFSYSFPMPSAILIVSEKYLAFKDAILRQTIISRRSRAFKSTGLENITDF
jgi:hypothetical protein